VRATSLVAASIAALPCLIFAIYVHRPYVFRLREFRCSLARAGRLHVSRAFVSLQLERPRRQKRGLSRYGGCPFAALLGRLQASAWSLSSSSRPAAGARKGGPRPPGRGPGPARRPTGSRSGPMPVKERPSRAPRAGSLRERRVTPVRPAFPGRRVLNTRLASGLEAHARLGARALRGAELNPQCNRRLKSSEPRDPWCASSLP
jgi:hypothetical protein